MDKIKTTTAELVVEIQELQLQLEEARETIDAIRTGKVDAIVVQGDEGHRLYTLQSADHVYRVFIEKMTEGAVTLNKDGIILYSNSQFASMIECPLSQVIGISFQSFIPETFEAEYLALQEQGWQNDCKAEMELKRRSRRIAVQLSLTTLDLDEGKALSIIVTDLTSQKETQRQLRSQNIQLEKINRALEISNHDLQQFASVASHDLQEPIRKIQVFSSLLANKKDELPEETRKYLEKIISSAERMKRLVVEILNYSKLSSHHIAFEPTDLNQVIRGLLEDYEITIAEKKARITVAELPVAEVNKGQIRQVFQNLISNALKFSAKDITPEITIHARTVNKRSFQAEEEPKGRFVIISVKDNGIGFDEKYVQNIFSLFERLNTKDLYEGTGIGLAIAKKIVEKHSGMITAHSKEGQGAEFLILLPLRQVPLHNEAAEKKDTPGGR